MNTVQMLNILLIIIIFAIFMLAMVAVIIILKMRNKKENKNILINENVKNTAINLITRDGKEIDSIYKFMEFDSITDNMIVRKNNTQYVMILNCKGINYDLLSEDERDAVESGFIEFLNTLRFPIQLYIQTRKLDLSAILEDYKKRTNDLLEQTSKLDAQINLARAKGNEELAIKLAFDRKRKQNIAEYGESIEEYTAKINESKNMLQQNMYLIITYYTSEIGDTSKYSKEEINDIVFSELYTRAQTLIRALASAEVSATVLNSEELAELLYVAYNRDQAEIYTLKDALNSQYDRLYSTARDVLEEKEMRIKQQIEDEATKVASKSIIEADEKIRQERQKKAQAIKQRAAEMVDEYKEELSKPLYEEALKQISNANIDNEEKNEQNLSRRIIRKNI